MVDGRPLDTHSHGAEIEESGRSLAASLFRAASSISRRFSFARDDDQETDEELELKWAAIQRLPTANRLTMSLFDQYQDGEGNAEGKKEKRPVDVTQLGPIERRAFIESLIKHVEKDNLRLLSVEAECEVVEGKPLPTIWNAAMSKLSVRTQSLLPPPFIYLTSFLQLRRRRHTLASMISIFQSLSAPRSTPRSPDIRYDKPHTISPVVWLGAREPPSPGPELPSPEQPAPHQ